jgi:LacI family transcriptional regulator, repressor for deo operon, udp, cdd, tsx, nupC, and nupG
VAVRGREDAQTATQRRAKAARRGPSPAGAGRRKATTIHDVAREAGVAASTVSRAFTHPDRLSAATRERVLAVAGRLGYRPNPHARALPTGRTMTLGLLVPDITNPFFFGIIRGVGRQAAAAGYTLILADTEEAGELEAALARRLSRSVDGFVLASSRLAAGQIREVMGNRPVVVINRDLPGVPGVVIDSGVGMRQAAGHLASLGHRRVAYLAGPRTSWSDAHRWRALGAAGRRLGISVTRLGPFPPVMESGAAAADAAIMEGATAVVAFNDLLAIGALRRFVGRGLRVPEDVSVLGCDDIFGADLCSPPLTTIAARVEEAGRGAVDLLLATRGDAAAEAPRGRVVLPAHLEVRASTGAAPGRPAAARP